MSFEVNGVAYCTGTAGSPILACPICAEEHFRDRIDVANMINGVRTFEKCFTCPDSTMEPIREDEVESRWKPFWKSLGHKVLNSATGEYE